MKRMLRAVIKLDKEDIRNVIAEKFCVEPENVDVDCFNGLVGYGIDERYAPNVRATVDVSRKMINIQIQP